MLPKIRLILAVMTAALIVAALGFGIFSRSTSSGFAIGLHSARGAPLERSLPEPPDWKQFIALAAQRRAEELNRLLELPAPEPLPGEPAAQVPAVLPESAIMTAPDGPIATPETEPSRQAPDPRETAAAAPSPPPAIDAPGTIEAPGTIDAPGAVAVASAVPAPMDEPSPAEPASAGSQSSEPSPLDVVASVPPPATEPPTVEAEVSRSPSPAVELSSAAEASRAAVPPPAAQPSPAAGLAPAAEPAPAAQLPPTETASSQRPESEPLPVDVALAVPPSAEAEAVPAPADVPSAPATHLGDGATLAMIDISAPDAAVGKPAAVPLPRPAPPRRNVRHPAGAKAQHAARAKAARAARSARAARARPVAPAASPASPAPFSGLYQQSHPSQ